MATLSQTLDMAKVQQADTVLAAWGAPASLVKTVHDWDFDPEPLHQMVEKLHELAGEVRAGIAALGHPVSAPGCWEGPAADQAEQYRKCVAHWWQQILDFILGLIDWLVQLIDYIVDALHWIASWITWIATAIAAIIAAVSLSAVFTLLKNPAYAAWLPEVLAITSKAAALLGEVTLAAVALAAVTWLVNKSIEWLQELIRAGRDALCGGGLVPRTRDWDPVPHIPSWPF